LEINETYYHPNLLISPGITLLIVGIVVLSGNLESTAMWLFMVIVVVSSLSVLFNISRVNAYVEQKGARLTAIKWAPFAPGWFWSGKNSTAYEIETADPLGRATAEIVRVSLWFGVKPVE
jgi:hypothetical protein